MSCSALDVFVHYDGKRAADIAPSRYSMRHTIAQQVRFIRITPSDLADTSLARRLVRPEGFGQ